MDRLHMSASGTLRLDSYSPLGMYGTFVPNPEPGDDRPLIGVAVGHDQSKAVNYVNALHAQGANAWVYSSDAFQSYYDIQEPTAESPVVQCVRRLDGLLLTGGGDISEKRQGRDGAADPTVTGVDELRDHVDWAAFQAAWAAGLPMLCICRGAQVANRVLGGTNYSDIDREVGGGQSMGHRQIDRGIPKCEPTMPVQFVPGTLAEEIFGSELEVNHDHHQAIKDPAPALEVAGRAPDGVIEAVVAKDHPLLGLQFHPELMWQQHPQMAAPFAYLVGQAQGVTAGWRNS
ncbi:MAG: gamma-glutamyl-gamma-aminobutyrate hydrolase family protein [Candidatus Xenobia bacterium]